MQCLARSLRCSCLFLGVGAWFEPALQGTTMFAGTQCDAQQSYSE